MLHTHYGVNKLSPMRSFLQGAPLKWSWRRGIPKAQIWF